MKRFGTARVPVRSATVLFVVLSVACTAGAVRAQTDVPSGIQVTPDGARTLVSKDVGGERWAIARNPDGTVTGNVFFAAGGPPKFVWCEQTSSAGGQLGFACSGSDACPLAPCGPTEWVFIAEVTLPESFFAPPAGSSTASTASLLAPMTPLHRVLMDRISGTDDGGDSPSGLQVTPDGRTLISKDVGAERWAISRNDDGTITGNVFFPGGGEPKFVWCEQTGESDGNLTARCLGADPCARDGSGDCAGTGWTFIADVTLPVSFFEPREPDPAAVESAIVAELGEDAGFQAVAFALERGYSLEQILRAALTRRLRPSGEIVAPSGATEPPSGPAVDVFTDVAAASSLGRIAAATSLDDFQQAFEGKAQGLSQKAILILLLLADAGYSIDQIVVEIFFGSGQFAFVDGKMRLVNGNTVIPPDGPPRFILNRCGNGRFDYRYEDCEGGILEDYDLKCQNFGLQGGSITECTNACSYDLSGCTGCGNGKREGSEACDGDDLGGKTCELLGYSGGRLTCDENCAFVTTNCTSCAAGGFCCTEGKACGNECIPEGTPCCGDGVREGSEQCDGTDLGGATCASQGQGSGSLSCSGSCTFDTDDCTGGGSCQGNTFPCEGGCAPDGADCCEGEGGYCSPGSVCVGDDACCPASHPKRCGNQCIQEDATCCEGLSCCGNGNVEGAEVCDGADLAGETCTSQGKPPGFLSCEPTCAAFDISDCGCDPGFKSCGDGCIPNADTCCDDGNSCPAGTICSEGGGCCGNDAIEGDEVCDGDLGCGGGDVCDVDCRECVSTTSCEGRCCAGRDDNCTPAGVSCYCDEYCIEAGDCCEDYVLSCG